MLTFPNITPAVFEAVLNELRKEAMVTKEVPQYAHFSPTWHIQGSGIKASVTYYDGRVDVAVQDKPWWMPEVAIGAKIEAAISAAQAAIARQGGAG